MCSGASLLSTSEVRSAPLPLTVHHGMTGEREDSSRMVVPEEAQSSQVQLIANVTDCLFHMQRGKEKRGPLGSQRSAAGRHSLQAWGRQGRT